MIKIYRIQITDSFNEQIPIKSNDFVNLTEKQFVLVIKVFNGILDGIWQYFEGKIFFFLKIIKVLVNFFLYNFFPKKKVIFKERKKFELKINSFNSRYLLFLIHISIYRRNNKTLFY